MSLNISKSRYCLAVQCPKILWLKQNKPDEFDDSGVNEAILAQGNEVGVLALGLFGKYTEVPYSNDKSSMIARTAELLEAEEKVIAEASFVYNGMFCSVDILKNLGGKTVEIYEVKSSTGIKEINIHDVAFQSYVLKHCGYKVERVSIVHIDNSYVRHGELELNQLFMIEDVTDDALGLLDDVQDRTGFLERYLAVQDEPEVEIGPQCFAPYSCGF